jgi:cytochrome c553
VLNQLHAFRDQTRADPDALAYMWGMASQLSDATIEAISNYYAAQAPSRAKTGDAKLMARGKQIFEEGVTSQGIPACATCHGPEARGNNIFPRLAGQHADYLVKQALVIQSALRATPVMHEVIRDLSRDQMRAVATYLESLSPEPREKNSVVHMALRTAADQPQAQGVPWTVFSLLYPMNHSYARIDATPRTCRRFRRAWIVPARTRHVCSQCRHLHPPE